MLSKTNPRITLTAAGELEPDAHINFCSTTKVRQNVVEPRFSWDTIERQLSTNGSSPVGSWRSTHGVSEYLSPRNSLGNLSASDDEQEQPEIDSPSVSDETVRAQIKALPFKDKLHITKELSDILEQYICSNGVNAENVLDSPRLQSKEISGVVMLDFMDALHRCPPTDGRVLWSKMIQEFEQNGLSHSMNTGSTVIARLICESSRFVSTEIRSELMRLMQTYQKCPDFKSALAKFDEVFSKIKGSHGKVMIAERLRDKIPVLSLDRQDAITKLLIKHLQADGSTIAIDTFRKLMAKQKLISDRLMLLPNFPSLA